jgi:hypothetical protein
MFTKAQFAAFFRIFASDKIIPTRNIAHMPQQVRKLAAQSKALFVVLSLFLFLGFTTDSAAQIQQTPLVVEIEGLTVDQHAQIYRAFAERNDIELFRSCIPTGLLLFHSNVNFAPGSSTFFDSVYSVITTRVENIGIVQATALTAEAFEQRCRQTRGGN